MPILVSRKVLSLPDKVIQLLFGETSNTHANNYNSKIKEASVH